MVLPTSADPPRSKKRNEKALPLLGLLDNKWPATSLAPSPATTSVASSSGWRRPKFADAICLCSWLVGEHKWLRGRVVVMYRSSAWLDENEERSGVSINSGAVEEECYKWLKGVRQYSPCVHRTVPDSIWKIFVISGSFQFRRPPHKQRGYHV